jgi:hypothetical protein
MSMELRASCPEPLVQPLLVEGMPKPVAPTAGPIRPDRQPGVIEEVLLRY